MSTGRRAAPGRWLLPHERWLGRFAGRVTAPPRGGQRWRFQQNYGPEGEVLLAASVADLMAALILLIAGFTLLGASGSRGLGAAAGYWIAGVGILSALVGMVRASQLIHAGRVFRAGRPFIRPEER